jgi:hypothetical protein
MVMPFVGVCGVRTGTEYRQLVTLAEQILPETGRFLMAGVKDSEADLSAADMSDAVRPFVHCDYTGAEPFSQIVEVIYGMPRASFVGSN